MNMKKILKIIVEYLSLFSIIMAITVGIAQVLLMLKYNISMSYFQYNLIEAFPKFFFLALVIFSLFIPYLFLKDKKGIVKLGLFIGASIILSGILILFNITSLQYYILMKTGSNLYSNTLALSVVIILIIIGCIGFVNVVDCLINNKIKRTRIRNIIDSTSFIISALLIVSVLYSSMYYFTVKNVPYDNVVDIIEIDGEKYVFLVPYNDEFIVSKFEEIDNNIVIDTSEHYLIDQGNCKIYKKMYTKVEYNSR